MLTQQQRIELSKKIVSIPKQIQAAQLAQQQITTIEIPKAIDLDNGNKQIVEQRKPSIDGYQAELQMLDGNGRTVLVEQDFIDASERKLGNLFFYNRQDTPTPSNPDGTWKNLLPFLLGAGIGRNYQESFNPVQKEQDLIDLFNSAVASFELLHPMERSTGQRAITNPTPPPADLIQTYPAAQTGLASITSAINQYVTFLTTQSGLVYTLDQNVTRQTQSVAAKNYIDNTIKPALELWLTYNDFNTGHGQTTSSGFYAYNTALLQPTKGNPIQLDVLKAAIAARKVFVDSTRIPQLTSYLGTVAQNVSTGEITSQSGLYGERSFGIVLRLNSIGGSLSAIKGLESAVKAQQNIIDSGNLAQQGYNLLIKVGALIAPASNNGIIHIKNASDFSAGDSVFVCGDGQAELSGTVTAVSGTRIDLDFSVPQKYAPSNNSRIYKLV